MQLHSKQIAKWPTGRRKRGERAKKIRLSRNEKKYFRQLYAHFLEKVLLGKPDVNVFSIYNILYYILNYNILYLIMKNMVYI